MTVTRQELLLALANTIAHAPDADRNRLAQALEDYAYGYSRSYKQMTAGGTMLASLLDTLEEASDARIHRDASGTPDERSIP